MKWMQKDAGLLLERAFLFGITGVVLCLIPLINQYYHFLDGPMGPLKGIGIGLQLFGLSIAVLVLRKRGIKKSPKEKAKKMVLVLAVSLIFFFLVI